MLSSCLLRHKTPSCLRSPEAQHTHVKMHALVWGRKLQRPHLRQRGCSQLLYRSAPKYSQLLPKPLWFSCQTSETPGEITTCIVIHILSAHVSGTENVLGSSSIFLPNIYVQKITALAKVITLALCRSYLTRQYSKRFTCSSVISIGSSDMQLWLLAFSLPSTQMLLQSIREHRLFDRLPLRQGSWMAQRPTKELLSPQDSD